MSFFVRPNESPKRSSSYTSYSHSQSRHDSSHRPDSHRRSSTHEKDSKPQYYSVRPSESSRSHHSSSHYSSSRARSRPGYVNRMLHQIKRYLRKLYDYARRHPMKLFMLVIMPLITGGALADFLRRFGIQMPRGLERLVPGMSGGKRYRSSGGGFGGAGGIEGAMKLAKMFI